MNFVNCCSSLSEFELHCDALEWSLADPIIITSKADIKSRADWKDRFQPFRHQVENLIRFCRRLPVTLLADDVGLGKTISAGLILSELMKRSRVSRVFIICPKILIPQWVEELQSKFGITAYGGSGGDIAGFRRRTETAIVTTYQSATRILKEQDPDLFDMLILDEAHKVRNLFGKKKPPKMATAIHEALQARMFKYVLMLTATPIQNRLWDIYSLLDCLAVAKGHRNPLGSPESFVERFVADGKNKARQLQQDRVQEFQSIVRNYMFRTRRIDAKLAFPNRKVKAYSIAPTEPELELQSLIAEHIHLFGALMQSSVLVALMSSPQALVAQLNNMAEANSIYRPIASKAQRLVEQVPVPAKIREVMKIVNSARQQRDDWRLVIFTIRKETQKVIGKVLEEQGISVGYIRGSHETANRQAILQFWEQSPRVNVLISTDAGAEGLNLQIANVLINYDLPWNPMIVEQRIGRVQRIGSKFRDVWVANVVHADSPEEKIVARLMEKLQIISHTVGDIETVLEATDDSNGDSLEKQIREMVIASLQGQNMELAARKAEESIQEAKTLFDEQQEEMDQTLGSMNDGDTDDPQMPSLEKRNPRTPLTDFVQNALHAEGNLIEEESPGLFRSTSPHSESEQFTFNHSVWETASQDGVFMGRVPVLYQQGKPAFERLVQRWLDRSGTYVQAERFPPEKTEEIVRNWVTEIPNSTFQGLEIQTNSDLFSGSLICRTRVSNMVDSYEKLLRITIENSRDIYLGDTNTLAAERLASSLEPEILAACAADSDLNAFRDYYTARLSAEIKKTEPGDRQRKLESDLTPSSFAEVSAITGQVTTTIQGEVTYLIGNSEIYSSQLTIENGEISVQPEWATCTVTSQFVPIDCTARCDVTGAVALKHELIRSEASGKLGLPEVVKTCEVSGRKVLELETAVCCLTSQRVASTELVTSELSGRRAICLRSVRCELTGIVILDDEFIISDFSTKRFRRDQVVEISKTQQQVHQSEAILCAYSRCWYLATECGQSDVTGESLPFADMKTSQKSGRKGHHSEIRICGKSAKELLFDEVVWCHGIDAEVDKSLVTKCFYNNAWYLTEDCKRSDVTHKFADAKELRTSEKSGRAGHVTELRRCGETGKRLLVDEVQRCEISNHDIDQDLIVSCPETGIRGSSTYFERCQESDTLVAPAGLGTCVVSQKRVRKSLLRVSQHSGQPALASEMVCCEVTEKWLLPAETELCSMSGQRVLSKLLSTCGKTGKRALIKYMTRSSLSGQYYLLKYLVELPNGKPAGVDEVVKCFWRSAYYPKSLVSNCKLTGLPFSKKLLNSAGEFSLLRDCLNGTQTGHTRLDQGFLSRGDSHAFSGVKKFQWLQSKVGNAHLFFGKKSSFGMFPLWFAVLAEAEQSQYLLRGNAVFGKRQQGNWTLTESFDME